MSTRLYIYIPLPVSVLTQVGLQLSSWNRLLGPGCIISVHETGNQLATGCPW
jgi:hypothetical protein